MAIPVWLSGLFGPVADLIDDLHTSKEEKMQIESAMTIALTGAADKILEYESKLAEARANIIIAEAKGESWLQRNWRPLLMCNFGLIITWNYVVVPIASWGLGASVPPVTMPGDMWDVLKIGVGGYIVGRSGEKITKTIMDKRAESKPE